MPNVFHHSVKAYYLVRDELCVCNDVVMRKEKIVVPTELASTFLNLAHESHQGMSRTKQRLRGLYWWPLMDAQVELLVNQCVLCQSNDKSAKPFVAPMKPVQFPNTAWTKLAMDIVGPFELGTSACKYAITLVDYFSKWPEVAFVSSVTTKSVTEFLKSIFSREGFPEEIITDHGSQFTSGEFEEYLSSRGIKHGFSSVYYPQANGAIERFNGVLKNTVQNAIHSNKDWKRCVLEFLAVYRATPHATTKLSPSLLLHKREMRTKLNVVGYSVPEACSVEKLKTVRQNVQIAQTKQKKYYDAKRNVKHVHFKVGDWVRVKKPGFITKGKKTFSDPVQVSHKLSKYTYVLTDGKSWNVSKLVKCQNPNTHDAEDVQTEMFDVPVPQNVQVNVPANVPQNEAPAVNNPGLRRSDRNRRPPRYLDDYVRR